MSGRNKFIAKFLLLAFPLALSISAASQGGVMSNTESSDCLSCDGTATVSMPLADEASYIWFDQDGGQVISETNATGSSTIIGLCPGVYFVQIIQGGLEQTLYTGVSSSASDAGEFQSILECSQNAPVDLNLLLNPTEAGVWSNPSGDIDDGVFDPLIDDEGLYSYVVNEDGCLYSSGIYVSISQQADPGNTTTYLICETYAPFEMIDLLAGTPESGGAWFEPGPIEIDGIFDPETMSTGLFTYVIDSVIGCPPIWTTLYVVENFLPDAGLDEDILVCPSALPFDMTSALAGNPEITGAWYDAFNDVVSNVFDPAVSAAGVYTYIVPGISPCPPQEAQLVVDFTEDIDPGLPGLVAACDIFGPIDLFEELGGTPTSGGDWFDPNGVEVDQFLDPLISESGIYTYELSGIGCASATVTVDVFIEQVPNAGGDQVINICESVGQLDLSEALGVNAMSGGGYLDIDSQWIDPTIDLLPGETQFFFYFIEGNVCPDDQVQINVVTDLMPNAGPDLDLIACENEGILDMTVFVPETAYDVIWLQNGVEISDPVFDPGAFTPADFSYFVFSGNTCPNDESEVSISVETLPFGNGSALSEFCSSLTNFDLDEALGGIDPFVGDWYDAAGVLLSSSIVETVPAEYAFVSNTNVVCPSSELLIEVDVISQPEAGVGDVLELCYSAPELNLFEILVGESTDQGNWYLNGNSVTSIVDPATLESGFYTYVLDPIGPCPGSSSSVEVYIDPGFEFNAGIDVYACSGSDEIQLGQNVSGSLEYLWEPSFNLDDISIASPTLTLVNESDQPMEIEYTAWVSNGICEELDTVEVVIYPLPEIQLDDLIVCEGDWIDLDTEEQGIHNWGPEWLFEDPLAILQSLQVFESQLITVSVFNEWGCSSEESFNVEVLPSPEASFIANPVEGCAPMQVSVESLSDNESSVDFIWELSNGFVSSDESPVFVFDQAGQYDIMLTIISDNGCMSLQNALQFITVHPSPQASFNLGESVISEIQPLVTVDNWSIGADVFEWYVDGSIFSTDFEPSLELVFHPEYEYWVCLEAKTEFGCSDSTCHSLFVEGEFWVYAPNTFTPDNDGINDAFVPIVSGIDPTTYDLKIFNRWGEIVFESRTPGESWIGNHQVGGYFVPNGTYSWYLSARHAYNADFISEGGHITIIR